MMKRKIITIAALMLMALLLCACGKANSFDCPFSDAEWTMSPEALKSAKGEPVEIYASVYGGDTYIYPCNYLGNDGNIKYMFSEDGQLASIAWSLAGENEEIERVFNEIDRAETKLRGKSEFSSKNDATNGNVWYLDDGDVMVSRITANGSSALQYAYIAKDFSKR